MKLEQIDPLQTEILQALLRRLPDVFRRKHVVDRKIATRRPNTVLRRHLGRGVQLRAGVAADELTEKPFALALAVCERRVEEIAAGTDGKLQRLERLVVVGTGPATHTPHADAELSDGPAGSTERAATDPA